MHEKTTQACIVLWARDLCKLPDSYSLMVCTVMTEYLFELMNEAKMEMDDVSKDKPHMLEALRDIGALLSCEVIEMRHAKELLHEAWENYWNVGDYIIWCKLLEEVDGDQFSEAVDQIIKDNPKVIQAYQKGKKQAIGALIGQAMKRFDGKINPKELKSAFEAKIQENLKLS